MSQIADQIKALQRIQSKIDTFQKAKELLCQLTEVPDFPGVSKEVSEAIQGFIEQSVISLNSGGAAPRPAVSAPMAASETTPINDSVRPKPAKDAVSFMMKNRALEKKRVRLDTPNGQVLGTVFGLSYPNVIVVTDTDFRIEVDPENLEVI